MMMEDCKTEPRCILYYAQYFITSIYMFICAARAVRHPRTGLITHPGGVMGGVSWTEGLSEAWPLLAISNLAITNTKPGPGFWPSDV